MHKSLIWVIDDDPSIRWVLERALQNTGFSVNCFSSAMDALSALTSAIPNAIITDIAMPELNGLAFIKKLHSRHPVIPIIIMTAYADLDSAVAAYESGAFEYIPKPFDIDEVLTLVHRATMPLENTIKQLAELSDNQPPDLIGRAPTMQRVFKAIGRLSQSNVNVLINGESGTGKELVARALHRHSPRMHMAFIALNMAAIPSELLESELFGHERGAFTGAHAMRQGRFEQANGGTLFLDEIGDMPAEFQTRLLRVLSDGRFYRVGGHAPVQVNVRIIAATHRNLEARVKEGLFREDLFHRLNVIRINIPALRERCEDIPLLMNFFLEKAAQELSEPSKHLSQEVVEWLQQQDWPGNVRQLENLCRWLTIMASSHTIHLADLPTELLMNTTKDQAEISPEKIWTTALEAWLDYCLNHGDQAILDKATPLFEQTLIKVALKRSGGHRQDAANLLGWGRNTLSRKLKQYGI